MGPLSFGASLLFPVVSPPATKPWCALMKSVAPSSVITSVGEADAPSDSRITFLYKLKGGACSKSYGLNVARLANLPASVLKSAQRKSAEFERTMAAASHESLAAAIIRTLQALQANPSSAETLRKLDVLWRQARQLRA